MTQQQRAHHIWEPTSPPLLLSVFDATHTALSSSHSHLQGGKRLSDQSASSIVISYWTDLHVRPAHWLLVSLEQLPF